MPKQAVMLIVEKGTEDASIIPLEQKSHVLGKQPFADITLANAYVSRRHAQIFLEGGSYNIRDLGSKNGTYINGVPLSRDSKALKDGDRIELGRDQVVLRFQEAWAGTVTLQATGPGQGSGHGLKLDPDAREVWVSGVQVVPKLSRKEFDVLSLLYRRKGQACTREEIAAQAWPERVRGEVKEEEIDQCVRRLRLRLEADATEPHYILSVKGSGYKLSIG